jgi:hypothetical protein
MIKEIPVECVVPIMPASGRADPAEMTDPVQTPDDKWLVTHFEISAAGRGL